jgi:hypothetical protein
MSPHHSFVEIVCTWANRLQEITIWVGVWLGSNWQHKGASRCIYARRSIAMGIFLHLLMLYNALACVMNDFGTFDEHQDAHAAHFHKTDRQNLRDSFGSQRCPARGFLYLNFTFLCLLVSLARSFVYPKRKKENKREAPM